MEWLIVFLAVVIQQWIRLRDYVNKNKGKYKEWFINNIDEVGLSVLAALLLVIIFMNDDALNWMYKLSKLKMPETLFNSLVALAIGLFNVLFITLFKKAVLKKINKYENNGTYEIPAPPEAD